MSHIFNFLFERGELFTLQLRKLRADRIVYESDHLAFFMNRVAEVSLAGNLLGIEQAENPVARADAPEIRRRRFGCDDNSRRVRCSVTRRVAMASRTVLAEQFG